MLLNERTLKTQTVEITPDDIEYPAAWKEMTNPPPRVYALGNIALLKERKFAVVGSRRTPTNALKLGAEISKALSERFALVTGTADGGDSAAIEGALAGSGKVICVLAGGFSSLPKGNLPLLERVAERGLLLSPCAFEMAALAYAYEYRNKLLAKLADGVLVLGAGEKSGALITAKYAKRYEKPIFALPYPPNSTSGCGCNALIKKGAYLTESSEDILVKYGIEEKREEKRVALTETEEKIYSVLRNGLEAHVEELAREVKLPAYKLLGTLSALEMKGLIVSLGGNRYAIV